MCLHLCCHVAKIKLEKRNEKDIPALPVLLGCMVEL
jgi:hypothetical protein